MDGRFSKKAMIELLEKRIANTQTEAKEALGREFDPTNGYAQLAPLVFRGFGQTANRLYGEFAAYQELLEDLTGA